MSVISAFITRTSFKHLEGSSIVVNVVVERVLQVSDIWPASVGPLLIQERPLYGLSLRESFHQDWMIGQSERKTHKSLSTDLSSFGFLPVAVLATGCPVSSGVCSI